MKWPEILEYGGCALLAVTSIMMLIDGQYLLGGMMVVCAGILAWAAWRNRKKKIVPLDYPDEELPDLARVRQYHIDHPDVSLTQAVNAIKAIDKQKEAL